MYLLGTGILSSPIMSAKKSAADVVGMPFLCCLLMQLSFCKSDICVFFAAVLTYVRLNLQVNVQVSDRQIKATMVNFQELNAALQHFSKSRSTEMILREVIHFKNQGVEKVLEFVKNFTAAKRYLLMGAPGAGKSSSWWIGICNMSIEHPDRTFICVWTLKGEFRGLLVVSGGSITAGAYARKPPEINMMGLLWDIRSQYTDAYLIVDGVTNEKFQTITNLSGGWVLVSSVGMRLPSDGISPSVPEIHHMDSWLLEDYHAAIKETGIFSKIPIKEDCAYFGIPESELDAWVQAKYFYCGGSARFMLEFGAQVAIREIDAALDSVGDPMLLLRNTEGVRSDSSISTIRQCFKEKYIMLSQYVTRKLLLVARDNLDVFIEEAKSHAGDNPAFLGWIHEFKVLDNLRKCIPTGADRSLGVTGYEMQLLDIDNQSISRSLTLKCKSEKKFTNTKDIAATFDAVDVLWIPKLFNFACYDACLIMHSGKPNTLITFQATISASHTFKQECVASLINHLGGEKKCIPADLEVWHIFVLQTFEQLTRFKGLGCDPVVLQRGTRASDTKIVHPTFWKTCLEGNTFLLLQPEKIAKFDDACQC